nr:hypothetical protein CFP56_11739 [Quercus suber]
MAEQIHHHVVDKSESASASTAPADVALNTINHPSAVSGHHTISVDLVDANTTDLLATEILTSEADTATAVHAENPSAGKAAEDAVYVVPSKAILQHRATGDGPQAEVSHPEGDTDELHNGMLDGSVDNSNQSDTDASRGDASENQKERNHARTNSVKKPATFSKVSVTKTFLAKSATPVPVAVKQGEKPAVLGTPAALVARPRLVAKSGSGLQSLQKPRVAVAPPPPKHLTDEELKQQYGIHLATRLQSDENGKDSKWADIDDDEDDWVPETVVWMDGTKSSLAPIEPEPEQKLEAVSPPKPVEPTKPDLSKLKKATVLNSGPPKTILKPGIAAQQAKQQNGTATSTGPEKPSLKAKSAAPTPVKSPWAPIAPVAAVSPVDVPVPVQQPKPPPQHVPMVSQDARSYEIAPPSVPAREIAADTFDRSWREGEGGSRELFNSANGRYEPAPEGRRSSVKPEGPYRKPAVLQRPSQTSTHSAEPPTTLQARNGTQTDGGPWQRRRGSSISQGSSLPSGRRMSVSSKGPEQQVSLERRGSAAPGPNVHEIPHSSKSDAERATFSQQSPWSQQMPAVPIHDSSTDATAPVAEAENPVKIQERVMREKRELAKKRRLEEEARMEQEKQERLKARLAALAGAGKSRKEREAEASATPVAVVEKMEPPQKLASAPDRSDQPPSHETAAAPVREEATVQAASHTVVAEDNVSPSVLPLDPQPVAPPTTASAQASTERSDASPREGSRAHPSPRASARAPFGQQSSQFNKQSTSSYPSPGDRKSQPFGRSPLASNDSFSSWATLPPSTNVWGSSGIGNGTFETSNSFAPLQQGSALPPPPGMNRISPQSFNAEARSPSLQHQQLADQQRTFAPPPGIEPRQESSWSQPRGGNGISPAPGFGRQANLPAPIGPPSRAHHHHQPPASHPVDKWQKAAQYMPAQYDSEAAAAAAAQKERDASQQTLQPDTIKETFKQTTAGSRLGGPRKYANTEYTIHDVEGSRQVPSLSPAPPSAQTQPSGPFSTASSQKSSWKQGNENTVRIPDGSLNPAHGGLSVQQPPIAPPASQKHMLPAYQGTNFPTAPLAPILGIEDQSPPPPEKSSYAASDKLPTRPTVKLPPPPPVVKLPPAVAPSLNQQSNSIMPQSLRPHPSWGPPGVSRPIVKQEAWQARFNGLFNRASIQTEVPPSPPKTPPKLQDPVLAVASSSKTQLDDPAHRLSATVSLPLTKHFAPAAGLVVDTSKEIVSKPTIDGMFSEELSFGSLPKVNVPRHPTYGAAVASHKPPYNMLRFQSNSKLNKAVEAQSKPELNVMDIMFKHHAGYFLKVPQTPLNNRLIRHVPAEPTSVGMHKERKVSRKVSKGKHANETVSDAPVTSTQATESKSISSQKHQVSSQNSPAAVAGKTNREGGRKKTGWPTHKGQARNAVPSTVQS